MRSIFVSAVVALTMISLSGAARADWTFWSNSPGGRVYLDYGTIKTDGTKRLVWELWDYDSPQQTAAGTYYSMSWLEQIDCASSMRKGLQVGYYAGHMQGGVAFGANALTETELSIAPNTFDALLQAKFC
ncbi:MAG TPA: surface-adhesin E family protein [Rhizomicrobium sp.]|nr:surface-adhesin E family protein [Rhizomicrobium sp.]